MQDLCCSPLLLSELNAAFPPNSTSDVRRSIRRARNGVSNVTRLPSP